MSTAADSGTKLNADYEKMFLEKLTLLNRTFLKVIEGCVKDMPDSDLSPTVRDYLKHVESLDKMYGRASGGEHTKKRPVRMAKRKRKSSANKSLVESKTKETSLEKPTKSQLPETSATTAKSAPALPPQSKFDLGSTSTSASSTVESDSGRRGRKRANRGGQEGGDDIVVLSPQKSANIGFNTGLSTTTATAPKIDFFKQSAPVTSSNGAGGVEKPKNPLLSFDPSSKLPFSTTKSDTAKPALFQFGSNTTKTDENKDLASEKKADDAPKVPAVFAFGTSSNSSSCPSFGFGKNTDEKKNGTVPTGTAPLFAIGKSTVKDSEAKSTVEPPKLSFSSSTPTTKAETAPKLVFAFSGQTGSSDVSAIKPLAPAALAGFKFGPPAGAATTAEASKTEEKEEDYVPPKTEAILQEEPDAILSTKCSVFVLKGKEYEKVGIGQLHIKKSEDDEKKILLIRAATTIGTVWVNSFIDNNTKCWKVDDMKLRVSCVNGKTPNMYLIRFPNAKTREQIEVELASKS